MDTPNLQRILEAELAEARKREEEAIRERERVESAYNAYMTEKPAGRRRSVPGQVVAVRQPKTMYDRIINAVEGFNQTETFDARAIFDLLGREDAKYESARPTITTTLRELEGKGQLKKAGHGVYQRS